MEKIIKYEDLNELLEKVGKKFYKRVNEVVEENRSYLFDYLENAILRLADGRKVNFKFE